MTAPERLELLRQWGDALKRLDIAAKEYFAAKRDEEDCLARLRGAARNWEGEVKA